MNNHQIGLYINSPVQEEVSMKKLFSCLLLIILGFSSNSFANDERRVPQSNDEVLLSFAPLVKKAAPAVVNIYTTKKITKKRNLSPFFNDPIFQHFFGNSFPGSTSEKIESSLGSGVIVKPEGFIITNYHVIEGSTDIRVVLHDRREFEAKIIVQDQRTDLAMLKIETSGEDLPSIELMDSDDLEVGDIVMAIGNPFGVGQTVTNGIVSAVARTTIGASDYQFYIQTDAAINPGNSGGALINMQGKLAGLNSSIFTKSGGSNGIGFAIPSNMVAKIIRSNDGQIVRPWLGITAQGVTADIAASLGLPRPTGAIISSINPDSPSAKAGLVTGDIVIDVDGQKIEDEHSLRFRIATYDIGSKATFKILRDGRERKINIDMVEPPENPARDLRVIKGHSPLAGATIGNLSPALADQIGINTMLTGVIITDLSKDIAARLGFHNKDIITAINDVEIKNTKQAEKILKQAERKWKITIKRGNRLLNIIWNIG